MTYFKYRGSEPDLFAAVRSWKACWDMIEEFLSRDALEVGRVAERAKSDRVALLMSQVL